MQLNETNIDKISWYKLHVARNASCRYANITEKKIKVKYLDILITIESKIKNLKQSLLSHFFN